MQIKLLRLQVQRDEVQLKIEQARLRQEILKADRMEFELIQLKKSTFDAS